LLLGILIVILGLGLQLSEELLLHRCEDSEKLILCTGAPGILETVDDPRSVISYTDLKGLEAMRASGAIKDGMLPKAKAIESAIRGGVHRVHVISYDAPDSILAEVFTNEGTGTLIVSDVNALTPAEQQVGKE
jgi:acetylglutamate kinase